MPPVRTHPPVWRSTRTKPESESGYAVRSNTDSVVTDPGSMVVSPSVTTRKRFLVPEISRFFGIVIRMYFLDHAPPHFHAKYGDAEAMVRMRPVALLAGTLPPRALALVCEWATLNEHELLENWRRLHTDELPVTIAPLE
jgi:hypothetical protein